METSELRKLVTCGDFVVARVLSKTSPKKYILKQMMFDTYTSWDTRAVVSTKYELQMQIEQLSHQKKFFYLLKEKPSSSDLENFISAGFRVFKIFRTSSYLIKEYCTETSKWRYVASFTKKYESISFVRNLEDKEKVLLVN